MSRKNLWQICHNKMAPNQSFTKKIVSELRRRQIPPKEVARELNISTERVRNWYYKKVGMTAYDLILLLKRYDFIGQIIYQFISDDQ